MVTFFQGKKILFIGPKTFNYETEIKNNLESLGAQVIYYNDKPFSNIFFEVLVQILFDSSIVHFMELKF